MFGIENSLVDSLQKFVLEERSGKARKEEVACSLQ